MRLYGYMSDLASKVLKLIGTLFLMCLLNAALRSLISFLRQFARAPTDRNFHEIVSMMGPVAPHDATSGFLSYTDANPPYSL